MRIVSYFFSRPIESILFLLIGGLSIILLTTQYYYYAVVPSLAFLLIFLIGRYPKIGYYVIVFLIPFGAYRGLSEEYSSIKIHWMLAFLLLIIIALQFVFHKKDIKYFRSNLWPWFLIFLVMNVISALTSNYPDTSLENVFRWIIAYLFIGLTMVFINTQRDFSKVLPAIVIVSITMSAFLALIGYIFNLSLFAETLEGFKRGTGGTYDPNNLALMIVFSLPFLMHWLFMSHRVSIKCIAVLFIAINLLSLFYTFSRGGAILLALVAVIFTIENIRKIRPRHIGFLMLTLTTCIVLFIIFIPSGYFKHLGKVANPQEERSIGLRTAQLYVGWEAFKQHPVFGSGPGTYRDIYANTMYAYEYAPEISSRESLRHKAHDVYLEVLVGTGSLGFIIFIIILFLGIYNYTTAKIKFSKKGDNYMASIISSYRLAFVAVLIYFFIFSDAYNKYFLISLALSYIAVSLSKQETASE